MEKQYSCQFCNNRFKTKNQAQLHENSLHLRRYSWSCAAIPSYKSAFYTATLLDGSLRDTCGFCGDEFPNRPLPDWDRRIDHLTNVHNFGKCNQAKKFYRADHFRAHLTHSHRSRRGKWINMLENVSRRDEKPHDAPKNGPAPMQDVSFLASKTGATPEDVAKQPLALVPTDEARIELADVEEALECQECYICGDVIKLDRKRAWQYVEPFFPVAANNHPELTSFETFGPTSALKKHVPTQTSPMQVSAS